MVLDPNGFSNSNTLGDLRIKAVARGPWTDGDKCFMKTVLKDLYYTECREYGRFAVWKAIDPACAGFGALTLCFFRTCQARKRRRSSRSSANWLKVRGLMAPKLGGCVLGPPITETTSSENWLKVTSAS